MFFIIFWLLWVIFVPAMDAERCSGFWIPSRISTLKNFECFNPVFVKSWKYLVSFFYSHNYKDREEVEYYPQYNLE